MRVSPAPQQQRCSALARLAQPPRARRTDRLTTTCAPHPTPRVSRTARSTAADLRPQVAPDHERRGDARPHTEPHDGQVRQLHNHAAWPAASDHVIKITDADADAPAALSVPAAGRGAIAAVRGRGVVVLRIGVRGRAGRVAGVLGNV